MVIENVPELDVPRNFSSDFRTISLISCADAPKATTRKSRRYVSFVVMVVFVVIVVCMSVGLNRRQRIKSSPIEKMQN
jgi:lipopolysaccharide export LptBFGC system permease protein LptF